MSTNLYQTPSTVPRPHLADKLGSLQLRLRLATALAKPLPRFVGCRVRVLLLRAAGFRIGHGTLMWGMPTIIGTGNVYPRLAIGAMSGFNFGVFLDLEASISIGDCVAIGHHVMILTSSHRLGGPERRAGEPLCAPVTIGHGAWVGSHSLILPGVSIGAGAVVSAGSLVKEDVPPNTLVSGKQKISIDRWRA